MDFIKRTKGEHELNELNEYKCLYLDLFIDEGSLKENLKVMAGDPCPPPPRHLQLQG